MTFIQGKITNIKETKTDGKLTGVSFIVEITNDVLPVKDFPGNVKIIKSGLAGEDINHINEGVYTLEEIIKTRIAWLNTDIEKEYALAPVITETVSDTPEKIKVLIGDDVIVP